MAVAAPAQAAAARPRYVAVDVRHIAVPVRAQSAVFTRDGDHLLFPGTPDEGREELYLVGTDGSGFRCLTCGLDGVPDGGAIGTGARLVTPFPDGRRILYSAQTSTSEDSRDWIRVLECAPSVAHCQNRRLLPVTLPPEPGAPGSLGLRMTWHLAPDGRHVVWHDLRLDGSVMVHARLRRTADGYAVVAPRVLNPPSAPAARDGPLLRDWRRWADGGALYEVKSFAAGGRDVVYVRFGAGGQADQWRLDLATGRRTRLTAHPDWDEDGGLSPDGRHLLTYSFRTMEQVEALGLIPRPSFQGQHLSLLVGNHYLASPAAIACMIKPWLLPPGGDAGGRVLGQPVYPFRGGVRAIANILGDTAWSPDSTRLALSEMTTSGSAGTAPAQAAQGSPGSDSRPGRHGGRRCGPRPGTRSWRPPGGSACAPAERRPGGRRQPVADPAASQPDGSQARALCDETDIRIGWRSSP